MQLHPASFYVHELKPRLSERLFAPAASRLLWLPVHAVVIAAATIAIRLRAVPWSLVPVLSLAIGLSFGGLMFLGHETLHGGVVRGRWAFLKPIVGWICFAPFALSPALWTVWHNQIHHANANRLGVDPDMYPSLEAYRRSRRTRFAIDHFALGGRRWRGILSLVLGFTVQSQAMLWSARSRLGMSPAQVRRAAAEASLAVLGWIGVAIWLGPVPFLFAWIVPVLVGNVVVMGFILTNHGLSPATAVNDPLVNTLSVTAPRWLEWVTLDFGFHVEHHLFPAMSGRHGRHVRDAIRERFPERYQSMGVVRALRRMHETGRVYKDETTLVDPLTGGEWPTLASRDIGTRLPTDEGPRTAPLSPKAARREPQPA